ncbi:MAG: NADH-quinone oxidoreductase subunit J [Prevotella sp.]|nr:NADH-quinone oxidoreductase subunit J [Prevotella sp.]MCM1074930.1 NADH-quinone oxidoreductase subunit J [Ruminococcus sp.]
MESIGNIVLYFVVSLIIIIFSVMTVTTRKILRAATYLLFVLIGTAVVYFQLGYQFLGAVQIAVYAGGILVLFVFSILLTHRPDQDASMPGSHRKLMGVSAAVFGVLLLGFALYNMQFAEGISLSTVIAADNFDMHTIGAKMLSTDKFGYLLPFEAVSVLLLACIIGGVTIARDR